MLNGFREKLQNVKETDSQREKKFLLADSDEEDEETKAGVMSTTLLEFEDQ